MNVILVGPDLKKRDLVAIADVNADAPQHGVYFVRDDGATVLGRTNRVVEQHRDVVTFVDISAHANTSYRIKTQNR